ncbi:PAS domain-containing protein [Bdellovibrionota bacterium FG-2]
MSHGVRNKADQSLQSLILDSMTDGVYFVRASDFRIVYANSKFEQLFGYSPGELIGKPVGIVNFDDRLGTILRRPSVAAANGRGEFRTQKKMAPLFGAWLL